MVLIVGADGKGGKTTGGGNLTWRGLGENNSSSSSSFLGVTFGVSIVATLDLIVDVPNNSSLSLDLRGETIFCVSVGGTFDFDLDIPNISSSLSSSAVGIGFLTDGITTGAAGCCCWTGGLWVDKGPSSSETFDFVETGCDLGIIGPLNRSSSELGDLGFLISVVTDVVGTGLDGVFFFSKSSSSSLSSCWIIGFGLIMTVGWSFGIGSSFFFCIDDEILLFLILKGSSSSSSVISSNKPFSFFVGIIIDDGFVSIFVVDGDTTVDIGGNFGTSLKKSSASSSSARVCPLNIDGLEI